MVTFQQLRDAKPGKFATAADDWLKLAKEAEAAAEDLYERGGAKLEEDWADDLGQVASGHCRKIAQDYQAAGMAIRGVVTTLDGLADALEGAKRNLESAIDFAETSGLKIDGNGKVTVPQGVTDPQAQDRAKRAGWLIWDAVNDATKIDNEAAASLRKLIQPANITKNMTQDQLGKAILNESVKDAGLSSMKMIRQTMPRGADPQTQAAWWNSLTPQQRDEYAKAAPVQLYDMKGIPADVKQQLAGTDGLNRIEMIRWAEKYGESGRTDVEGMPNCTNFVSYAMHDGGGLATNDDWNAKHRAPDLPFVERLDKLDQTPAWAAAQNHHDYLVKNGGSEVPVSQARPGDILYMRDKTGEIHHTSIVTAVTPDGEIMYTQHNENHTNLGLSDRMPHNDIRTGQNDTPIVVRPQPNWN